MACERCDGTGWRPIDRDGVRRVERCECWRESFASRLLDEARVPPRYQRCDLETFTLYPNEKLVKAVATAREFIDRFPAVQKGLVLIGPPGVGKTHIAVSILKKLVEEKRVHGLFYDTRELLKEIRSTYDRTIQTAEMAVLRPVMEAEVLVLDDLGAEKLSEWVEETMNLIVNTRYNERRITIITTNYEDTPNVMVLDSLIVRVGFRMHSRLHEMCEFLEYDGGDYRMLPPNGGPDDLLTLWKREPNRKVLPAKANTAARAMLNDSGARAQRELEDRRKDPRELKWPGGKAGRS